MTYATNQCDSSDTGIFIVSFTLSRSRHNSVEFCNVISLYVYMGFTMRQNNFLREQSVTEEIS